MGSFVLKIHNFSCSVYLILGGKSRNTSDQFSQGGWEHQPTYLPKSLTTWELPLGCRRFSLNGPFAQGMLWIHFLLWIEPPSPGYSSCIKMVLIPCSFQICWGRSMWHLEGLDWTPGDALTILLVRRAELQLLKCSLQWAKWTRRHPTKASSLGVD